MALAHPLERFTVDGASDAPEMLLLVAALPMALPADFDTQVRQPLHALPQPLLEQPQRPPRQITLHA